MTEVKGAIPGTEPVDDGEETGTEYNYTLVQINLTETTPYKHKSVDSLHFCKPNKNERSVNTLSSELRWSSVVYIHGSVLLSKFPLQYL